MQNGYVERFNRGFRNEVLEHAHQWLISYNEGHPHESLGNIPPTLFRQQQTNRKAAPEFSV